MASGHDSHTVDEREGAEHPGAGDPVGGFEHEDHGHGHDDHGSGGDSWVLIPIAVGLVIGLVLAIAFGTGAGLDPFG